MRVLINGGEAICHVWGAYRFHRLKTTGNSLSSEGLVLDSYPPKETLALLPQEAFSIWFGDIGYWPITHTELWPYFSGCRELGPGFAYSISTPPISFCWVSACKCQFHFVKARQLSVLLDDSGRNSLGQCLPLAIPTFHRIPLWCSDFSPSLLPCQSLINLASSMSQSFLYAVGTGNKPSFKLLKCLTDLLKTVSLFFVRKES